MTVWEKLAAARKIEKGTVQRKPSSVSTSPVLAPLMAQQAEKSPTMPLAVKAATQTTRKSATAKASAAKPASGASTYLTGGTTTTAPSYGAGVQARELKELDIKPREKKTSTEPQKAQAPAWQGLMNLSSEELEQRHEKAKAERDVLSGQVAREETPAAVSSYAAVAGRYKAKETNPISSVAAASGVWDSKAYEEGKRLNSLRMDVSRKQGEVNDLAAAHYYRKNQEQFAKLETDAGARAKFKTAQELTTDLDTISKALSAPTAYNGMDTRFQSDGEAMKRKYGTDDLQALQRTLTAQKAGLVKELEAKGYDFETMAGYDLMLQQQENYIKTQERTQKDAEEHPVSASGLSVVLKPLQVADFARTSLNGVGHSNADDLGSYVPANVYDMYTTNMVQTIRGTVSKKIEENTDWEIFGQNVGSFLYNTGMSMADSAFLMTTLGAGGTYIMGLSAAAEKSKEIIEQGGSNSQAFWGGVTAGVAEYVFEKFSVENLLKIKGVEGWKAKVKAALRQGGIEASEEMLTECANIISDAMVMGERSGLSTAIKEYKEQGMTEDKAVLQACLDSIGQVVVAGWSGFLSGIGMAGGKLAINQAGSAIYNRLTQNQQTMIPAIQGATEAQKTATDGVAAKPGEYRLNKPQNVEMPTVPIIDLSVSDIPGQVSPVLTAGNSLRAAAIERARRRLGLDKNSAAYIPASNVMRDGNDYVLKITKASLNKMLSPKEGSVIPVESIVVMDNIERIANNGVYFDSKGDRDGRSQIAGFDYLKTTVYIDGAPYEVKMRVRLVQEVPGKGIDNVLYYFTPEEIVTIERVGTQSPTDERRALIVGSETMPTPEASIPQTTQDVNTETGKDMAAPASQPVDPLIADIRSRSAGQMASQPIDPLIADIRSRGTGQTVTQPVDPLIADIRSRGAEQTAKQGDKAEDLHSDRPDKSSDIADSVRRMIKTIAGKGKTVGFAELPKETQQLFRDGLAKATPEVKEVLRKQYRKVDYVIGAGDGDRSYYSKGFLSNTIQIGTHAVPSTLAHELFHMIDDKHGISRDLTESLMQDYESLSTMSGGDIRGYLLQQYPEAFSRTSKTGMPIMGEAYRGIADILNGLSGGKETYGFRHSVKYWAEPGALEAEAWAQFGRIQYENKSDVLEMLKKVFPNFYKAAIIALKGAM